MRCMDNDCSKTLDVPFKDRAEWEQRLYSKQMEIKAVWLKFRSQYFSNGIPPVERQTEEDKAKLKEYRREVSESMVNGELHILNDEWMGLIMEGVRRACDTDESFDSNAHCKQARKEAQK